MKYDYLIVGAGFSGSVLAERLATISNKKVLIVEKRNHIGGNAYDEYDEYGILVHRYGPHIFHTNSKVVFDYLSMFTEWIPYEHKVLGFHKNEYYPIPINRITLNKLYKINLQSKKDVNAFYKKVNESRSPILNSEDIIISKVGRELFDIFYKNFTFKQWRKYPHELSPSVCGRIPIRNNDDCRYFSDKYQFMPKSGYTKMFEKMLKNKNIEIILNQDYKEISNQVKYDKVIYTGPIDYYFNYEYGRLPYRSLRFEYEKHDCEYYQDVAQVNYVDLDYPFTRVVEHKQLSGQKSALTTISKEYSQYEGEPYYPIPTEENRIVHKKYIVKSKKFENLKVFGRLAEYQYYNMDQVIIKALKIIEELS
jgi:UDP-galactopyranose mutase